MFVLVRELDVKLHHFTWAEPLTATFDELVSRTVEQLPQVDNVSDWLRSQPIQEVV
jgi:hypothetical protein